MQNRYTTLEYIRRVEKMRNNPKKPEKCVYPNCFECPYDDCVADGTFRGESALNAKLGQLAHKSGRRKRKK